MNFIFHFFITCGVGGFESRTSWSLYNIYVRWAMFKLTLKYVGFIELLSPPHLVIQFKCYSVGDLKLQSCDSALSKLYLFILGH